MASAGAWPTKAELREVRADMKELQSDVKTATEVMVSKAGLEALLDKLLRENEQAINRYHETALRELERQRATSSTPDYEQLAKAVYDARVFAERTRRCRVLQRHIADHGC